MLRFSGFYFILFLALFLIETLIALYVHDQFIRPFFGDVLVVILVFCFVKIWFKLPTVPLAFGCLLFAFFVEATQYFNLFADLKAQYRSVSIILGTHFDWLDLLAYTFGFGLIVLFRKRLIV
ncbi:MAG: DUF2809 domain-containing protein [Flavobacteriales bacterium]